MDEKSSEQPTPGPKEQFSKREIFKAVAFLLAAPAIGSACRFTGEIEPSSDYTPLEEGKQLQLWYRNKNGGEMITPEIRYASEQGKRELVPLNMRSGQIAEGDGKIAYMPDAFKPGESTTRKPGEITETTLTQLTKHPSEEIERVGVYTSPSEGFVKPQSFRRSNFQIKEGDQVVGIPVITAHREGLMPDEVGDPDFEINQNPSPRDEVGVDKFSQGWAVGGLSKDGGILTIHGYVYDARALVPAQETAVR